MQINAAASVAKEKNESCPTYILVKQLFLLAYLFPIAARLR